MNRNSCQTLSKRLTTASLPPSVFLTILTLFITIFDSEKIQAQACGSCANADCAAIKQYADKTAALGGSGKIWKYYTPNLNRNTGVFTTYSKIITSASGQVSVMQEIQVYGPSNGVSAQAQAVVATRTYQLFALSDVTCSNPINPNIWNDGASATFNPAWTNLLPNTDYKLALTTNLGVMAAGYNYQGFNIRFYHTVRPVSSFAFNCGSASAVGTFYANGLGGQNGTLTVPITGATAGAATFTVSGGGFTGSTAVTVAAGQTSVSIPITYDGSGAAGNHAITVSSSQGTGTCTPNIAVKAQTASFAFSCGTASATGTYSANGTGGQTGTLTVPLSNAMAGVASFNVSGGGFSGSLSTTLTAGQTSVSIPITYDGSGVAGSHYVTITSPQGTGGCALNITVVTPSASFAFNCGSAAVIGEFVANNVTNQNGFVTVPISSALRGNASFTVSGTGFTGSLTTVLTTNQTSVTIPITYDGSGAAGSIPLSISSSQGTGTCNVNATVTAPSTAGAITFNCPTTANIIGTFTANGTGGQKGMISVNFTTQTVGEISLAISGGGFTGSLTTSLVFGQTGVNMPVTYDGSGAAGNHTISVTSSQATGTCSMSVPVQSIFTFACNNYNTFSNFEANSQSQTGTLVVPLSNTASGSATFTVSGGGFVGSLTTVLRDSQSFVAIPVIYDGSAPVGVHAVSITSSQGSGTCTANVKVKDPALQGCDYIVGDAISIQIHSNKTEIGFTTKYILVDENGVIKYSVSAMPFTGVAKGSYEAYAVNYSGTAPTLTVGTNLNAIGGSCVSLSNALPIKVCTAFQFNCGAGIYTGTFIANNTGGQTGTLYVTILHALPISTTLTVTGSGFTGTKTQVLTGGQDTIVIPITYNGTGSGGVIPLSISAPNAEGTCTIPVIVLPPPPSTPFSFTCNSAVLETSFVANGATQSGNVTLNLGDVTAGGTTNFTVTATNFGGGMQNVVLGASQTSIVIPIEYNGAMPPGTFNVTIASPHASNTCAVPVPVAVDCTVQVGVLTRN